jgi:hypothetical protein
MTTTQDLPQIMELDTVFPLRYFINLGRRQDRRVETEIALAQAGFTAERFPAVDARFVRRKRGYESAGRYALALSQRLVLRTAALKKADAVLVLEDDVIFHPQILQRLSEIELPDDWGIFYLGCAHQKRPWRAGTGLVRTQYALDTHAFAVRAPYYRKVMAALARKEGQGASHARASDWFLANLHREIPTYACYPNLAWQAMAESDLAGGRYSNYTPSGEQIAAAGEIIGLQGELWGATRWNGWRRPELAEEPALPPAPPSLPAPAKPKTINIGSKFSERPVPRLGLLFLTRGDVCHPEVWNEFTADAKSEVGVFSHPKDEVSASRGFLSGTMISDRHETGWGDISLVRAMVSLLKAGLADESLTHFAFVSETCIPVRSWSDMKRRLTFDPRSMLPFETSSEMKEKHRQRISLVQDLPDRCRRLHPQWCLLDREAASCVGEVDLTEKFAGLVAPDEHYIGSVLALRGFQDYQRINRSPSTWVRWLETGFARPEEHVNVSGALAAELAAFPGFFARKFPEGSDVAEWGLHRS